MLTSLPAPQIVELDGADALVFTQAQFASDVAALEPGHWQWSAWLSAQGRVRSFFHLLRIAERRFQILLRGGSAALLRDQLARYVMRAKVQVRVIADVHAYASADSADLKQLLEPPRGMQMSAKDDSLCIAMPGGSRWLLLAASPPPAIASDDSMIARAAAALADIDAGIVTVEQTLEDRLFPDWIGLRELGAVSVRKGCYPGQEVVARLHFKGGNKRWLHRIAFAAESLPAPGSWLPAEGENAALVLCSAPTGARGGRALVAAREDVDIGRLAENRADIVIEKIERVRLGSQQN